MAQRTTSDETLTRAELATYFQRLATEFDEDGSIDVEVGNKTVRLKPPEAVDLSVDVVERSTMFRGNHETVAIELHWKPEQSDRDQDEDSGQGRTQEEVGDRDRERDRDRTTDIDTAADSDSETDTTLGRD